MLTRHCDPIVVGSSGPRWPAGSGAAPAGVKLAMYKITTGIHIHFAHHIRGHAGPCVSIHGHTWKFEVSLTSADLDAQGFVVDFDDLYERVRKLEGAR